MVSGRRCFVSPRPLSQALSVTQRWLGRRDRYRPAGEVMDPSSYGVELLDSDRLARAFVETHHYSASFPAARLRVGLYRSTALVGVAVFSVPAQPAAIRCWTGTDAGVELGRFVLLDDVPGNGESWFLARAFRLLRSELPDVRTVLSYSDPFPRQRADGSVLTPGHVGVIYQAHNGRFVGRARAETLWLDRDGRTVSRRALSKLRHGERGEAHVYRRLVELGAPTRRHGEDPSAYVDRALADGPFRRVRHPGNLAYAWALEPAASVGLPEAHPYPRRSQA